MAPIHPQLAAIDAELRAATARARALADGLDETIFHARPSPQSWSMAECLAHLNLTTEAYLPLIRAAIAVGRARSRKPRGRYRRDLLGWFLWRATEPPVRSRFKTAPAFVPQSAGTRIEVMRDFERLQDALAAELQAAHGLDLGKLRIVSPFARRLSYNLYSAFSILPAHQRRHLWQAEQALARARAQQASP
jgi:hypothetical protein